MKAVRKYLHALLAMATLACSAHAQEQTPVRVRMDWTTLGYHAPFYYGVAKGIYARHGLKVNIEEGRGSAGSATLVGSGSEDFAFADTSTVAQLIGRGVPVKVVLGVLRGTTIEIFYAKDRGISKPADLKGRKISMCAGDAIQIYGPAYFRSIGLGPQDISMLTVDCSLKYTVIAQGKADAVMSYATAAKPLLKKVGVHESASFKAGGSFALPSHGIVTSDRIIKDNPALVRRFAAATTEAWLAAAKDPDGAVAAITAVKPMFAGEEAMLKDTLNDALAYIDTPATKGKPFGWQSPEDWSKALALMIEYAGMRRDMKPEMVFTNDFVKQ